MNQKKTANFGRSKPAWRSWRTVLFKRKQEELPSLCLLWFSLAYFSPKICFCILYRMLDIQKGPAPFGAGPFCYVLGSMICIVGKISLAYFLGFLIAAWAATDIAGKYCCRTHYQLMKQ